MTAARVPALVALVISLAFGATAWRWRTGAVGGSDSSCYALMTKAYAGGRWQPASALATVAPWPEATRTAAPGGFLPSARVAGAAVPVCAPGYSLLVAPLARVVGLEAVHVVPAVAGAVLVWLAFAVGRRLHSPWAGTAAALLVASSPIVLFQAVQPMNDITTGAVWVGALAALLARRPVVTGILIGVGLLVRPNLAPAAVMTVLMYGLHVARTSGSGATRRALRAMILVSLAALPGVALALLLNASLYGSPVQSGYGDLGVLFAWAHVPENLARYGRTWLATSTPLVLLAVVAPFVVRPSSRGAVWTIAAVGVALSVVYLAYRPFPEWWYLRFLLPAVVSSLVLAATALAAAADRVGGRVAPAVATALVLAAAFASARSPEAREALGLARLESRFPRTAALVAARLPPTAVLVTGWESGAIRFGSEREIVMWDALDPAWLDRALIWLEAQGRSPALVLEAWEQEAFRARFAGQAYGALDWPPRYDIGRRVLLFVPGDRDRYRRGEAVTSEPIFDAVRPTP